MTRENVGASGSRAVRQDAAEVGEEKLSQLHQWYREEIA